MSGRKRRQYHRRAIKRHFGGELARPGPPLNSEALAASLRVARRGFSVGHNERYPSRTTA
jgi:hypothetical protein